MALNNGGPSPWGNPRPGGPWGSPPPGPPVAVAGPGPGPDLDDLIRQAQDAVRTIRGAPAAPAAGRAWPSWASSSLGIWAASGFYRVQPDEEGVVLRFGAFNRNATPGLNYHIPWPVESVRDAARHAPRTWSSSASARATRTPSAARLRPRRAGRIADADRRREHHRHRFRGPLAHPRRRRLPVQHPQPREHDQIRRREHDAGGDRPHADPARADRGARPDRDPGPRRAPRRSWTSTRPASRSPRSSCRRWIPPAAVIEAFRDVQRAAPTASGSATRPRPTATTSSPAPAARPTGMIQEAQGFRDSQEARAKGEAARFSACSAPISAPRTSPCGGCTSKPWRRSCGATRRSSSMTGCRAWCPS